jgi:hypothetical protein
LVTATGFTHDVEFVASFGFVDSVSGHVSGEAAVAIAGVQMLRQQGMKGTQLDRNTTLVTATDVTNAVVGQRE